MLELICLRKQRKISMTVEIIFVDIEQNFTLNMRVEIRVSNRYF